MRRPIRPGSVPSQPCISQHVCTDCTRRCATASIPGQYGPRPRSGPRSRCQFTAAGSKQFIYRNECEFPHHKPATSIEVVIMDRLYRSTMSNPPRFSPFLRGNKIICREYTGSLVHVDKEYRSRAISVRIYLLIKAKYVDIFRELRSRILSIPRSIQQT